MRPGRRVARGLRTLEVGIAALVVLFALLLAVPGAAQSPAPRVTPSSAPASGAPSGAASPAPSGAPESAPSGAASPAPSESAAPWVPDVTSPAPDSAPAALPSAVPLSDVATQIEAAKEVMRQITNDLENERSKSDIDADLAERSEELSLLIAELTDVLESRPALVTLRRLDNALRRMRAPFAALNQSVSARAAALEADLVRVDGLVTLWRRTEAEAQAGHSPAEVSDLIASLLHDLLLLEGQVKSRHAETLGLLARISDQLGRLSDAEDLMAKARVDSASLLLVRDTPPLWSSEAFALRGALRVVGVDLNDSAGNAVDYLRRARFACLFHLLLVLGVGLALRFARPLMPLWAVDNPACAPLLAVFDRPWVSAYLLIVPFQETLYPLAPPIFDNVLYLLALLASVRLLSPILDASLRPCLAPLGAVVCLILMRHAVLRLDSVSRLLFLFESVASLLYITALLQRSREVEREGEPTTLGRRVVRGLGVCVAVCLLVAVALNFLGFSRLARHLGTGILSVTCSAVVTYGLMRVAQGLVVFLLGVPPLGQLRMLEHHREDVTSFLRKGVRFASLAVWLVSVLDTFGIRQDVLIGISTVLRASLTVGKLDVSLGGVLGFLVAVWASFAVSRLTTFLLDEEVFPRLSLARGLPYAIRTVFHYAVLFLGFFVATLLLGVDVTSLTFFVGAFSVGIGFGLQNIVNNFVSGLILLFERPANVGDLIQAGGYTGELRQIGLRACVLRVSDGSEVVLPNGMLLSQQMVNWTLSDRRRLVEVEIPVPLAADSTQVFTAMLKVARDHPHVLSEPAPQALYVSMSGNRMTFRLLAWTQQPLVGCSLKSDLGLGIVTALRESGTDIGG